MAVKNPQLLTALGVVLVIVVGLVLAAGGGDVLFPAPTLTPVATATYTAVPTPTIKPLPESLAIAYINDTLGYLVPCNT